MGLGKVDCPSASMSRRHVRAGQIRSMHGADRDHVDGLGRTQQATKPPAGRHRRQHRCLLLVIRQPSDLSRRQRQHQRLAMVSRAHQKQHLVPPRQPVEQPCQRAQRSVERPRAIAKREVHDTDLGRRRRARAIADLHALDGPVDQVNDQVILGDHLVAAHPRVRSQNRTDVHRPPNRLGVALIAVKHDGGHRGAMASTARGIVLFEPIRVVNHESVLESTMVLRGTPSEAPRSAARLQRLPAWPQSRGPRHRGSSRQHLSDRPNELDILAAQQGNVVDRHVPKPSSCTATRGSSVTSP